MSATNQPIYLVTCAHPDGAYMPERDVSDLDRATTVRDIATFQFENVARVLECDPVSGTCRDVTEAIAREVMTIWANEAEPLSLWQYQFVQMHVGVQAAQSFRRAA